jgi:hypothetical protein
MPGDTMKLKSVMTVSKPEKKVRLFRLIWERGTVGDGKGYSAKLAVSMVPILVQFRRYSDGWRAALAGLSLHYRRAYGGRIV